MLFRVLFNKKVFIIQNAPPEHNYEVVPLCFFITRMLRGSRTMTWLLRLCLQNCSDGAES